MRRGTTGAGAAATGLCRPSSEEVRRAANPREGRENRRCAAEVDAEPVGSDADRPLECSGAAVESAGRKASGVGMGEMGEGGVVILSSSYGGEGDSLSSAGSV